MAGSQLVDLWKEWGLQTLVLLSFALQVELLILAELRRRRDSGVLRAFVWLAYLLADSTAIYVLGHLSATSRCKSSSELQLTSFWAPFLLLHLGGQDNITAYAIEDNRLWLRHLQTLAVQVAAAAYVLVESSTMDSSGPGSSSSLLRPASILMFLVGVAKYGERVWALKCANSSPSAGNKYRTFRALTVHTDALPVATSGGERDTEALLSVAHLLLDVPKDLLKGPLPEVVVPMILELRREEAYRVAEMQLSLMHDIFYTKSTVTHTWYGLCIRVVSLLAAAAALLLFLFHLLLGHHHGKEGNNYNGADVAITRVLLVGAVVLEIVSMSRVMFSSWTCALLARWGHDNLRSAGKGNVWSWLGRAVAAIRRKARAASWARYWSGSMGQQDLLRLCARSRASRSSKIARWMEVEDWWNRLVFSGSSVPVPASVKNLVVDQVLMRDSVSFPSPERIPNSRGQAALRRWGLHEELAWSLNPSIGLECVIVIWHVATSIYLHWYKEQAQEDGTSAQAQEDGTSAQAQDDGTSPQAQDDDTSAQAAAEAAEVLSNYTLFLLASRHYMLPSPANRNVYVELCFHLTTLQNQYHSAGDLAGVLRRRGDGSSGPVPGFLPEHSRAQVGFADILGVASKLGAQLVGMEPHDSPPPAQEAGDKLKLIAEVWVEILCYAAYRCEAYSHAKQTGNGGELVTVVAILLQYVKRINREIFAEERAPVP
ncbi:unnamed protein product [Alopecurus aequalis]